MQGQENEVHRLQIWNQCGEKESTLHEKNDHKTKGRRTVQVGEREGGNAPRKKRTQGRGRRERGILGQPQDKKIDWAARLVYRNSTRGIQVVAEKKNTSNRVRIKGQENPHSRIRY